MGLRTLLLIVAIPLVIGVAGKIRDRGISNNGATVQNVPQDATDLPGGSKLPYTLITSHQYGSGDTAYWIFEPSGPAPSTAPVVVFLHGWSAMNPSIYGAWIEHTVKRGNIVIFPVYQENLKTPTKTFTDNAIAGAQAALNELNSGSGHVKPDLSKFAIVGHSVGGLLAANMTALAQTKGLPKVLAVMSVEPGKTWTLSDKTKVSLADLSVIPADTLLLTVVGDADRLAKDVDAKKIFNQTPQIPTTNKNFITVQSDDHGRPALKANHFAPAGKSQAVQGSLSSTSASNHPLLQMLMERRASVSLNDNPDNDQSAVDESSAGAGVITVDALDYFGYWKLFDGLTDAAFYGKNRKYALGNTPEQTFMGNWTDGTPVKPLIILESP